MTGDHEDLSLLGKEHGEPSRAHDELVFEHMDRAGQRIASRRRQSFLRRLIIPAALAASVLIVPFMLIERSDTLRETAGAGQVEPRNGAELASTPVRLHWAQQPDASGYHVSLRDVDGSVIFEATTKQPVTEVQLPDDVRGRLAPGETYYWSVAVEQSLRHELGPYWFQLEGTR